MRRTARWWWSAATPRASGRGRGSATPKRVAYGPTEIEALDIFDCGIRNAPINVFVHGGAWRRNKAADYALHAEPLVRAGAHCVILDFINVDEAGGDLFPMYEQVRRAHRLGVRATPRASAATATASIVSAHSSGSHLAGVRADARLARGKPAARHRQGRGAAVRHVRSQAGAAVEALVLREASPTGWRSCSARSAISTGSTRR